MINFRIIIILLFICNLIQSQVKNDTIQYLDLSHKKLKRIPDLSNKIIKKLNLSYNKIDSLDFTKLPKGLEKLNVSHNFLMKVFILLPDLYFTKFSKLKELNLSYNKLKGVSIATNIRKLKLNNNDIYNVDLDTQSIEYLDISNNKNLSNIVSFDPKPIDTLKRKNILNNKHLIDRSSIPMK